MTKRPSSHSSSTLEGAAAGLAGTAVMMAMRSFDQKYAPKTIPPMRKDPGEFILKRAESATGLAGEIPKRAETTGAMLLSICYGTIAGVLYAKTRGHPRKTSSLLEGGLIGITLYAIAYAGWLPLLRLTRPAWKQSFPQVAGEALRHIAFGVSTAAVYGAINARDK